MSSNFNWWYFVGRFPNRSGFRAESQASSVSRVRTAPIRCCNAAPVELLETQADYVLEERAVSWRPQIMLNLRPAQIY